MKKMRFAFLLVLCVGALLLCSCSEGEPVTESCITAVEITGKGARDEREISVTIELTDADIALCGDGVAYLYALDSHMDAAANLEELIPVAEFAPKRRSTVKIPLVKDGTTLLYASFAVGAYDQEAEGYALLTSPLAVSNPHVLAENDGEACPVYSPSVKGLVSDSLADAVALGISQTLVKVPLEDLILDQYASDAEAYVFNGKTYYVAKKALSRMDAEVEAYTSAGIRVHLQFILGSGCSVPALYFEGRERDSLGYAVNMSTREAAERMEGLFDLLASRYAYAGEGISFIVGNRVNNTEDWWDGGRMSVAEQVANYQKLLRVAYTAMCSYNPQGHTYVSLDSCWNVSQNGIKAYLSRLVGEAAQGGDYEWQVACDLYGQTSRVWEQDHLVSNQLTVSNLSELTQLLTSEKYLMANGEARGLLLTDFWVSVEGEEGESESDQAASYVYAYMFAAADPRVRGLIYAHHTDTSAEGSGLRTREEGKAGQAGVIWESFQTVDAMLPEDMISTLEAYTGEACSYLLEGLEMSQPSVLWVTGEGEVSSFTESDRESTVTLRSFDKGDAHGVTKIEGVSYGEFCYEESLSRSCLHLTFAPTSAFPVGVSFALSAEELSRGDTLYLDMYHSVEDAAGTPVDILLCLSWLDEGDQPVFYQATARQEDVRRWETVGFDISAFAKELSGDKDVTLSLMFVYPQDEEIDGEAELTVALDALRLSEKKGVNVTAIIVAVIVALATVGVVIVVVVIKRRRA